MLSGRSHQINGPCDEGAEAMVAGSDRAVRSGKFWRSAENDKPVPVPVLTGSWYFRGMDCHSAPS